MCERDSICFILYMRDFDWGSMADKLCLIWLKKAVQVDNLQFRCWGGQNDNITCYGGIINFKCNF